MTKIIAPYITAWDSELDSSQHFRNLRWQEHTVDGKATIRAAYQDETPDDRDAHGVLWQRQDDRHGQGTPAWKKVHARRQRRAMEGNLCQVCADPADTNGDGTLFVLPVSHAKSVVTTRTVQTMEPPVCGSCADRAPQMCPHLRSAGFLLVRVRSVQDWGVLATTTTPIYAPVAYDEPRAAQAIAGQKIVTLSDITILHAAVFDRAAAAS